jgi:predicted PurR-regulated permease PerM
MIYIVSSLVIGFLMSIAIYFFNLHKGTIKDRNKNFIPDPVEEAAKEIKRRAKKAVKEAEDVVEAIKGKK